MNTPEPLTAEEEQDDLSLPFSVTSILRSLDACDPEFRAKGPVGHGQTFSGWSVPDWLVKRIRHTLATLDRERAEHAALRDALFDEYGVNVVDEALGVAIHSTLEMQVNRDRWEEARRALRAALDDNEVKG